MKYRVSMIAAFPMVAIAVILDMLQILLTFTGVGALFTDLVTFIAIPSYALWFLILGVNYFSGKKAGSKIISVLGASIIELIPVVDALPAITIGVIGVIHATRAEDRERYKAQQKAAAEQAKKQAANDNQRMAQIAAQRAA